MSTLREYLDQKREAILTRRAKAAAGDGPAGPLQLAANVTAEGRTGVRRIRIRDFQILADTPPDFAGFNFGPGSPELQLGVLGHLPDPHLPDPGRRPGGPARLAFGRRDR